MNLNLRKIWQNFKSKTIYCDWHEIDLGLVELNFM